MLSADALMDALDAELTAFDALRDILSGEHDALLANDVDAVSAFAGHKASLVERLRDLAARRTASLQCHGFSDTAAGIEAWLACHRGPGAATLPTVWQRLLDAAREARRANESNGRIVLARIRHNQGALDALHTAARRLRLYGPDGLSNFSPDHRELGRA